MFLYLKAMSEILYSSSCDCIHAHTGLKLTVCTQHYHLIKPSQTCRFFFIPFAITSSEKKATQNQRRL